MQAPSAIITEEQLLESTGYGDRGWLERWLRDNGIRYWRGRGGRLLTTVGLMEAAQLGKDHVTGQPPREQIDF